MAVKLLERFSRKNRKVENIVLYKLYKRETA